MKTGSLIGFTEAELALILLVVFLVVLPNTKGADGGTPVVTTADSLRTIRDSLAQARDSLVRSRDSLQTKREELATTRDSLRAVGAANAILLKGQGELRSRSDPLCSDLRAHDEKEQPFGPIRILEAGFEFEGRTFDLDGLARELRPYTDRGAQLQCRYVMRVSYGASLPAARVLTFRRRFGARYAIRDAIDG
jgi:hypothetical protein